MNISDYGLIGNTRTAALVSKRGSLDWCCFPRFDSPSIFCSILDPHKGGFFSICPDESYEADQKYLEDTNILETSFVARHSVVKLVDFFPVDAEQNKKHELWPQHEILRILTCHSGEMKMMIRFVPRPYYGLKKYKLRKSGKLGIRCENGSEVLYLNHNMNSACIEISADESEFTARFSIKPDEQIFFSLTYSDYAPAPIPALGEAALNRLERSCRYWREWILQCTYRGEYLSTVKRSALLLKLLAYAPSGAIIAAPTTSLPEDLKGVRNWDYRYCWLRDAAFTIRSLVGLGFHAEAKAYVDWILHSTSLTRPRLQVVYTVYGEASIPEKILSWLSGFQNSRPVRIGNAADSQFQLDVYGEIMHAVFVFSPYMENFDSDTVSFLTDIGKSVCELWNCPDEGIWEIRSSRAHHTHSKAMAWVALDCLIKLCEKHHWKAPLEVYKENAKMIRSQLEEKGFNARMNCYTATLEGSELDASLLMMPLMDYQSENKERISQTILKIQKDLTENGLVYRYLHRHDGLSGKEGTFAACSFWLVEALAKTGLHSQAKELFESLLKRENSLALWPEEISAVDNEFLGNYPQAFTHTGLINAALSLQTG